MSDDTRPGMAPCPKCGKPSRLAAIHGPCLACTMGRQEPPAYDTRPHPLAADELLAAVDRAFAILERRYSDVRPAYDWKMTAIAVGVDHTIEPDRALMRVAVQRDGLAAELERVRTEHAELRTLIVANRAVDPGGVCGHCFVLGDEPCLPWCQNRELRAWLAAHPEDPKETVGRTDH